MYLSTSFDQDLKTFYDSVLATNVGALNDIAQFIISNDTVQAIVLNTTITPVNLSEINAQSVNDIYLESWEANEFEFNEDQKNALLNIAYQNPITGGEAVYDARVILFMDANDYYFEFERMRKQNLNKNDRRMGKIIPNPNSGTMQFVYALNENEKGTLLIFDVKGNRVKEYSLQPGQKLLDIEMNDAACGIYFYRLTVNDQIVLSNKIVIER